MAAAELDANARSAAAVAGVSRGEAASVAAPDDLLSKWLGSDIGTRLQRAGCMTLADVVAAAGSRRAWWTLAPGIGAKRADAIEHRVRSLLAASREAESQRTGDTIAGSLPSRAGGQTSNGGSALPRSGAPAGILAGFRWPPAEVHASDSLDGRLLNTSEDP